MDFADRIKKERVNYPTEDGKKLSQQGLADKLHTDQHNVSNWENRICKPNDEHLEALCNLFQRDRAYFFGEIETKTHDNKFILDSTGLSEKSIERLTSLLSVSNGDSLPDTKDDSYKYESGQKDKATLTLQFINNLLEDDYSYRVLTEDLRSCYENYSFWQNGEAQRRKEATAIHALSLAEQMKLQDSGNYQAGISDEQVSDRKASYESKRFLAQEHYSLIIEHIMQIIYKDEP